MGGLLCGANHRKNDAMELGDGIYLRHPLRYFEKFNSFYYMTDWTREFIHWGLQRYAEMGFAGLKKKDTKKKYEELGKQYPLTQVVESLRPFGQLPPLVSDI